MKFEKGQLVKFKTAANNVGDVTINRRKMVRVLKNGQPVKAGDLVAGQLYTVDLDTGEISQGGRRQMKTSVPQVRAFEDMRLEMIRLLDEALTKDNELAVKEAFKKVRRLFEEEFKPKAQHPRYTDFIKSLAIQLDKAEAKIIKGKPK